jgi:myosin heavy subunit
MRVGLRFVLMAAGLLIAGQLGAAPQRAGQDIRESVAHYLAAVAASQAPELPERVRARAEADAGALSQQLDQTAARDPRVQFARVLAATKQGQYSKADTQMGSLPGKYKASPLALKTDLWLNLQLRRFDTAHGNAKYLVKRLWTSDTSQAALDEREDTAAWLGELYGYMAGPAGRETNTRAHDLLRSFNDTERTAFQQARDDVLAQYGRLSEELQAARANTKQERLRQRDARIRELQRQGAELEKQIAPLVQNVEAQERGRVDDVLWIDEQQDVLLRRTGDIQRELRLRESEIPELRKRIDDLRRQAEKAPSPLKEQLLAQAAELEVHLNRTISSLDRLRTMQDMIDNRKTRLDREMVDVSAHKSGEKQTLEQLQSTRDDLKREERALRAAAISVDSSETAELQQQAESLDTYAPFFWDKATELLLKSFP